MHGNMNVNIRGCIHDSSIDTVTCQFLIGSLCLHCPKLKEHTNFVSGPTAKNGVHSPRSHLATLSKVTYPFLFTKMILLAEIQI